MDGCGRDRAPPDAACQGNGHGGVEEEEEGSRNEEEERK